MSGYRNPGFAKQPPRVYGEPATSSTGYSSQRTSRGQTYRDYPPELPDNDGRFALMDDDRIVPIRHSHGGGEPSEHSDSESVISLGDLSIGDKVCPNCLKVIEFVLLATQIGTKRTMLVAEEKDDGLVDFDEISHPRTRGSSVPADAGGFKPLVMAQAEPEPVKKKKVKEVEEQYEEPEIRPKKSKKSTASE